MALTPRQGEIQALLDQDQTPPQIAKKLGITDNAVYQQIRRIRAGGGTGRKTKAASKTKAAKKTAAKSKTATTRKRAPRKRTPALKGHSRVIAAVPSERKAELRAMTPLQAIRARRDEINAQLKVSEAAKAEAEKALKAATEVHETNEAKFKDERQQLDRAEAALTGKPVIRPAPKGGRSKNGNGSGSKAETKAAVAETPPTPPDEAPAPAGEPQGTAAPLAAVPDTAPEDAPVVEEPETATEEPELVGAGVGEERPGYPTDPAFEQGEDGFGAPEAS